MSARACGLSVSPCRAEGVCFVCVAAVTWYINVEDGGTSLCPEMTFIRATLLYSEVPSGRYPHPGSLWIAFSMGYIFLVFLVGR